MTRRAFVFGSNGPEGAGALKFAHLDAARMRTALSGSRCGFEVLSPQSSDDPQAIERLLGELAEACAPDDTLVVFFSGHGMVQASGLLLMLDKTDIRNKPLTTALRAESIVHCLRTSKANRKLLILDCCHAGMVYQDSRFKAGAVSFQSVVGANQEPGGESFVAIVASDRLEQTREFDHLQGSFLTSALCRALGEDFDAADKDRDGAIDLGDVREWLARVARDHNATHDQDVPVPFIFGRERGQVYLTRPPSDWTTHRILIDEIPFVIIPCIGRNGVWAIGQTPVTNGQYGRYSKAPSGKRFEMTEGGGRWVGPFHPWDDPSFNDPDQPVVCIDLADARRFAACVKSDRLRVSVVPPEVWDFAAFGATYPSYDRRTWAVGSVLDRSSGATAPAPIGRTGQLPNRYGAFDLLGNVWEWTYSTEDHREAFLSIRVISLGARDRPDPSWRQELRGGSFLDDLSGIRPTIAVSELQDRHRTRHSDLGMRLAATIPFELLSADAREQVKQRATAFTPEHYDD